MLGQTHAAAGVCAAAFVLHALQSPAEMYPLGLLGGLVGGLAPDIDEPRSTASTAVVGVGPLVGRVLPHRGPTHSLLAVAGVYFLVGYLWPGLAPVLPLAVGAGYLSHLLLDMLTPDGIRPFWPMRARVSLADFFPSGLRSVVRTGGPLETVVVRPAVVFASLWLVGKGLGVF